MTSWNPAAVTISAAITACFSVSVLAISSDLPEIIGMSDRIVVLRNGEVAGELPGGVTEEDVIRMATGEGVPA